MKKTICCTLLLTVSLCGVAIAQQTAAELPTPQIAPQPSADESAFGAKIARTMTALATSTPTQRNHVRVLFYGQSITAQNWSHAIGKRLKKEYPHADFSFKNRSIGGFTGERLMKTAHQDLYPFYPDLVVFHVYSGAQGDLEDIISNIRRKTTAEILVYTHHVSHEGNAWAQNEYDKQSQLFRDLAAKYECELVDVRKEWKQYLAENHLKISDLLRDVVHLNAQGCKLMEALVWRHFRYDKRFENPHASWIKTVPVQPDADGSYTVKFTGNRVNVITDTTGNPRGRARILIDGQPPSANPKAYAITRPSKVYKAWWPALYTLGFQSPPLVEKWTLKLTEISDDAK